MTKTIFSDKVLEITERVYTYEIIKQVFGEYDADEYQAYQFSQGEADKAWAVDLNTRGDKLLRLTDRRTRGYKFLQARRKEFDKAYEKQHPRPPKKILDGLAGII